MSKLVLICLLVLAIPYSMAYNWHFSLVLRRFSDIKCDDRKYEKRLIKSGHCKTFHHGFHGFSLRWAKHVGCENDFDKYGNCTLRVYADPHCGGNKIGSVLNVGRPATGPLSRRSSADRDQANHPEHWLKCQNTDTPIRSVELICLVSGVKTHQVPAGKEDPGWCFTHNDPLCQGH